MMKLNSIYVSTQNFARAKKWYEEVLFERRPDSTTDRFVFWKLGEVHFGVFNPEVAEEDVVFGNNCVPNVEVNNTDALHDRLANQGVNIIMPLNNVNGTRIFQCHDSEGNVLEFYQWIEKPA